MLPVRGTFLGLWWGFWFLSMVFISGRCDPGERPTPLQVKLANGATCSAASHDQTTHYQDRRSWLYCDSAGDAVLLLPKDFDPTKGAGQKYFDKTNATWTAQYSVNNMAPKTVAVTKVVYAP